jgi:hypothetical protein
MVMTGITVIGLFFGSSRQIFNRFGWPSIFLLIFYVANAGMVYIYSNGSG